MHYLSKHPSLWEGLGRLKHPSLWEGLGRLFHAQFVWLSRWRHCRGFGIQSPTDYQFVRYVINEKWPYYAYQDYAGDDWLTRKLGCLYFRVANWRQPSVIIDGVGAEKYLLAGCRKARIAESIEPVELACVSIASDYQQLFQHCTDQSVIIFQDIWKQKPLWRCIQHDQRATICYDLYYCGIVIFDSKRTKQSYIVNF